MACEHIHKASELVTSAEAIRDGFVSQALTKTSKAEPYLVKAKALWVVLQEINPDEIENILKLIDIETNRADLLAAAGFSDKAIGHLEQDKAGLKLALKRLLEEISEQVKDRYKDEAPEVIQQRFREEILYRFLLTKGDSLGGQMRNITGAKAQQKLTAAIVKALVQKGIEPQVEYTSGSTDVSSQGENDENAQRSLFSASGEIKVNEAVDPSDAAGEGADEPEARKITRISWDNRRLLFDRKPKLIDKNIDLILIDMSGEQKLLEELKAKASKPKAKKPNPEAEARKLEIIRAEVEKTILANHSCYLASGELKGGIDPAGADEHWKTAKSALNTIRTKFVGHRCPALFFIGAVIVTKMADEIFSQLQSGELACAANLTVESQLEALATWLVSL